MDNWETKIFQEGGAVQTFSGGVLMLIPMETYSTYDFPGVGDPDPVLPSGPAHVVLSSVMLHIHEVNMYCFDHVRIILNCSQIRTYQNISLKI